MNYLCAFVCLNITQAHVNAFKLFYYNHGHDFYRHASLASNMKLAWLILVKIILFQKLKLLTEKEHGGVCRSPSAIGSEGKEYEGKPISKVHHHPSKKKTKK